MKALFHRPLALTLLVLLAGSAELRSEEDKPLSPVQYFCQAASVGNVEKLQAMLQANPDLLNAYNPAGFAALHYAAMHNRKEAVAFLIAQKADIEIGQAEFHGKPLQYAASSGHVEVASVLLEAGAIVDSVDKFGRTPLMWAAQEG